MRRYPSIPNRNGMTSKAEVLRYRAEINGIDGMTHDEIVMIAEDLLQEYDTLDEVHAWFQYQYGYKYCPDRTQSHLERIMADTRDGHETDVGRHTGREDDLNHPGNETSSLACESLYERGRNY